MKEDIARTSGQFHKMHSPYIPSSAIIEHKQVSDFHLYHIPAGKELGIQRMVSNYCGSECKFRFRC